MDVKQEFYLKEKQLTEMEKELTKNQHLKKLIKEKDIIIIEERKKYNKKLKFDVNEISKTEEMLSQKNEEILRLKKLVEDLEKLLRESKREMKHIKIDHESQYELQFQISQNSNDEKKTNGKIKPTETSWEINNEIEQNHQETKLGTIYGSLHYCRNMIVTTLSHLLGEKKYTELCDFIMKWTARINFVGTNAMQDTHPKEGTIVQRQRLWREWLIRI